MTICDDCELHGKATKRYHVGMSECPRDRDYGMDSLLRHDLDLCEDCAALVKLRLVALLKGMGTERMNNPSAANPSAGV